RIAVAAHDLLGDQVLQLPEIAVADAVLLELADRVEQILGDRSRMAAGPGEDRRHPRVVLFLDPERALQPGPEGQRLNVAMRCLDGHPTDRLHALQRSSLALQQPYH